MKTKLAQIFSLLGPIFIGIWLLFWIYLAFGIFADNKCWNSYEGIAMFVLGCSVTLVISIITAGLVAWLPIIVALMGLVLPWGGLLFLKSALFDKNDQERVFNFIMGLGLLLVSYFYTTKVSFGVLKNDLIPWALSKAF